MESKTKYHIINSVESSEEKDILVVIHNAGFFSCSSIALQDIMIYYNEHKQLPNVVDRFAQYGFYKKDATDNLIPFFFKEDNSFGITIGHPVKITSAREDPQYSDYKLLDFKDLKPFIDKFFTPSDYVQETVFWMKEKYHIDLDNTCAVFYRGNDKNRETTIAPYEEFILKAKEIQAQNPDIWFLVQPDETEFLEAFQNEFTNVFSFKETPHMRKQDSAMFFELPIPERAEYGSKFLSAVLVMSQCKHLITHSGNGGLWSVIYRGNGDNVYQWLNDKCI